MKATPLTKEAPLSGARVNFASKGRVCFFVLFSTFRARSKGRARPASDTCLQRMRRNSWNTQEKSWNNNNAGRSGCCCNITGTYGSSFQETRPRAFLFNSARGRRPHIYSNKNSDCKIGGGSCVYARVARASAVAVQIAQPACLAWVILLELLIALILASELFTTCYGTPRPIIWTPAVSADGNSPRLAWLMTTARTGLGQKWS